VPELPEVAIFKQYLDATSLHQVIAAVQVHSPRVVEEMQPQELVAQLEGRTFESTWRRGKHLFVALDDGNWLAWHFGMTGQLKYYKLADKEPDYVQMQFDFVTGYHLAYVMPRKLGQIALVEDPDDIIERKNLGPDALRMSYTDWNEALSGRRGMVKSTLMNQQILAGIGNIYSDEILYQARLHPRIKINTLGAKTTEQLYKVMQEVLAKAIECRADPGRYPDSYLTPRRQEGAACPHCNGKVQRIKVSGRSGYFCPQCQKTRTSA
jgi:formamidopyrimidine-DNA glycosylase